MTSLRRVERWIAIVRLVAVPFALFQVAVSSAVPPGYETAAWATTGVLTAGAAVLFALARRTFGDRAMLTLAVSAQVFDTAVVSAYVIAYSPEQGTLVPETLFLPLIAGCLRFAVTGGLVVAVASAPVMLVFERLHSRHIAQPFRWDFVSLHVGLEVLLALAVGRLVQRLGVESREASLRAEEAVALRDELARRVDLLDAANRCARALGSSLELDEAFGSFIRELSDVLPFDRVAIVLAEDGDAHVMAAAGAGAGSTLSTGSKVPVDGTILHDVLAASEPVYRPRLDEDRYLEEREFRRLGLGSRVAAPLLAGGGVEGMLVLARSGEDAFSAEEIELVGLLARLVATAAQNIRAYDAERRTVDELHRLSTMRADFVSLVSHELRTPMASVLGSARTLQARWRELSAEHRDAFLAVIADETERLAGLVGEVLDTSRIEAGTFTYAFGEVDLAGLVEETVSTASLGQDAVRVVARIPHPLPPVHGDGARLRQVLANLVDNAVKYSPDGELVEVHAAARDGRVVVDVSDHGPGIAEADQELIFEKFGRVSGTSAKPGSGLGLYIARAIVEAHGGRLEVTSSPGCGATFTLSLPATT